MPVTDIMVQYAHEIREDRDIKYGNRFLLEDTDERWVGDLGEICMREWLYSRGVQHNWLLEGEVSGEPDFILSSGLKIDVKTVKRKVPMREHYECGITANQIKIPVDLYCFMSYEITQKRMWVIGVIDKVMFAKNARFFDSNSNVHAHYKIRKNHSIYNIYARQLYDPMVWMNQMSGSRGSP